MARGMWSCACRLQILPLQQQGIAQLIAELFGLFQWRLNLHPCS
jgi:hypothetical protein